MRSKKRQLGGHAVVRRPSRGRRRASRDRGRRSRCRDNRRCGRGLPARARMKASRRGSGSSVRNVPPPIATMWPFTSGQDRLTSGAGHGCRTFYREGAYSDVTPRPRLGGAGSPRARRRRTGGARRQGREAEAHDDGAHGHRAADDARPRTSAASAARASRRPRSARGARAGRPRAGSARSRPTATAARGRRSRSSVPQPKVVTSRRPRRSRRARAGAERAFRLTLLHNNDGESKYVVGDSIANYGGITRFKTVLDRLRAEAATRRRRPATPTRARSRSARATTSSPA